VNHDEEVAALHALVRDAHECIKDLNAAMNKAERVIGQVEDAAAKKVDEEVTPVVEDFLRQYSEHILLAIKDAEDAVYKRFTDISDILLGETRSQKMRGGSLVDTAEAVRRAREEAHRIL
jgi:hypothetical protein